MVCIDRIIYQYIMIFLTLLFYIRYPCIITRPFPVVCKCLNKGLLAYWHLYMCYHKILGIDDYMVNTLRPRQNGRHFTNDFLKWIFLNENVWISIKIWLNFVPKGRINNIPVLDQIMAWRRPGDKPLSEPMMISLPKHICVTRPQ